MLAAAPCRVWWITICVCVTTICVDIYTHMPHICRYDDRVYVHMFFIPSKFRFLGCESIFFSTFSDTPTYFSLTHILALNQMLMIRWMIHLTNREQTRKSSFNLKITMMYFNRILLLVSIAIAIAMPYLHFSTKQKEKSDTKQNSLYK